MTSGNFSPNICMTIPLYKSRSKLDTLDHTQLLSPGFQQSQKNIGPSESTVYKSHDYQNAFKKNNLFFNYSYQNRLGFSYHCLRNFTFLPINILLLQFLNI